MEKTTGIYCIISKSKPERIYIGSAVCIEQRRRLHLSDLKLKRHKNGKLQNHYNKYGKKDLLFLIIRSCPKERLLKLEQFFMDREEPWFNIRKIAESNLGIKWSKETIQKMSKPRSKEHKQHLRDAWKTRLPMTEETKQKMRNKIVSEGTKQKHREDALRNNNKQYLPSTLGMKHSEECKQKHRDYRASDETRQKIKDSWVIRKLNKAA